MINRRADGNYDADGNLLSGPYGQQSYDAGGRMSTVGSFDPVGSTTRGLDGDGRQVRTENLIYDEQSETWVTTIRYYLRSSDWEGRC